MALLQNTKPKITKPKILKVKKNWPQFEFLWKAKDKLLKLLIPMSAKLKFLLPDEMPMQLKNYAQQKNNLF